MNNKPLLLSLGSKDNSFSQMFSLQSNIWIHNAIDILLLSLKYFTKVKVMAFVKICCVWKEVRRLEHGEENLIMDKGPLLLFIGSKDNLFSPNV